MRTRKARRKGGTRTSEFYPLQGFKYTNPTSSTLNLNLYSRQVGGNCKNKKEKLCKKSCKKLCYYVEKLPKKDFVSHMKYKIDTLQASIETLKTEHKRLSDAQKTKFELTRPPSFSAGGWFNFNKSENKNCIEPCTKACMKNADEECAKVIEASHPTPENMKYTYLVELEKRLKSEIAVMNYQLTRP